LSFAAEKAGIGLEAIGLTTENMTDFIEDFRVLDLIEVNLKQQGYARLE